MIVIKVELHSAVTGEVKQIAKGQICNVGGSGADGVYSALFHVETMAGVPFSLLARSADGVRHNRSDHVWKLIARALEMAFP